MRGYELVAASFEMWDRREVLPFQRKLMPLISLPRDYLDSTGKTMALVWVIFLLTGPHYDDCRSFCDRIVSVTTDMGTERLLARMPDCLNDFYYIFLGIAVGKPPRAFLMPIAVQAAGWCHGWDIILKRGLKQLIWFPQFLEGVRALVYLFRARILIESLCKQLFNAGLVAISEMLDAVRVPSIAEWRWGTLNSAMKSLSLVLGTLRQHYDPSLFKNSKDPVKTRKVASSLRSVAWAWQFKYVAWFCDWIVTAQSWGKGSAELERVRRGLAESDDESGYDSMRCGRRLPEAEDYIRSHLQIGLDEAASWQLCSFPGCSNADLDFLKTSVRYSFALATKRFQYVSMLPWLLAKLPQAGVKQRCLDQYASHDGHHPLTLKFLSYDDESGLRRHIDNMNPDGSGMSDYLLSFVRIIQLVPFDDSIAESPHAVGNRIGRHSPHAGFAWSASTMRLDQNLQDVRDQSAALGTNLQDLWLKHTSILQTAKHKLNRPMRVKPKVFQEKLYMLGRFMAGVPLPDDAEQQPVGSDDDDDHNEGP